MDVRIDIEARLFAIETRIDAACRRAGRRRSEVTLVGASKVQPVAALAAAFAAGLTVFGENRVQEAEAKAPALPAAIDWHLIGPLQSNKVRRAIDVFSTIHSIDRLKVAHAVDRVAGEAGVVCTGLLEVNLAGEASKHGFEPEALNVECLEQLAALEHLEIVGLMAIPPFGESSEESRPWFRRLRELRDAIGDRGVLPPWRGALSMGMSHDFEVAIEEGATYVRVGTDLFGPRTPGGEGA
jgi:PLP dependent protein